MASAYDKASLVMLPNAYKDGKVYSVKPEDRSGDFTFTRPTAATRVNADGNIEKETGNLLLQSNQFDTTWTNARSSEASGQSGYDGTSDAWLLQSTVSAISSYLKQNISNSGVYTMSVYAKAGTSDWMSLNTAGSQFAFFDLANGVLGSKSSNVVDSSIESIGNGWHRCSATLVNNNDFYIFIANGNNNSITNSGDNIYIQDAQLEQGLVARDYIETTTSAVYGGITDNVPRLDYTDSSCPALLLEPLRTNQLRYSEYQSADGFTLGSNITWNGFVESPEGVNNASRFTSNVQGFSYVSASGVVIPSGDFTFSMWVKGVSGTFLNSPLNIAGLSGTFYVYMNETPVAGEDWKLVYGTGNNTGSAVTKAITLPFYDQPVGSVLEIYGFQLEAGAYPTSYIPTYGSSVSRVADSCSKTGIGSLLGTAKGSFFIDIDVNLLDVNGLIPLTVGANSSNLFYLWLQNAGNILAEWYTNGGLQAQIQTGGGFFSVGDRLKIAVAYQNNDFVMYINGTLIGSDTSGSAPTPSELRIGQYTSGDYKGGLIKQTIIFPTRLTDSELTALTTI